MANFSFTLTEVAGTEETVIQCACKTPSPTPGDFKRGQFVYDTLTAPEKAIVDAFITLAKSKCV